MASLNLIELTQWPLGGLNEFYDKHFQVILEIDSWGISCEIVLR